MQHEENVALFDVTCTICGAGFTSPHGAANLPASTANIKQGNQPLPSSR